MEACCWDEAACSLALASFESPYENDGRGWRVVYCGDTSRSDAGTVDPDRLHHDCSNQ